MPQRLLGVVIALAVVAACTDSPDVPEISDPDPVGESEIAGDTGEPGRTEDAPTAPDAPLVAVPDGPAIVEGTANSLVLVHDVDGGERALVSYRADGTEVAVYSVDPDQLVVQPIWSPDGRRIAWVRSTAAAGWELVSAAVDGTGSIIRGLPGRPDYITYDPTASRLLALTPSPLGFGLVVVDLDAEAATDPDGEDFSVVDLGVPYFSDFAADGNRLIAHVGVDLRVVDLAGEVNSLQFRSGSHQTPAWHPTDDIVFFTTDAGDGDRLVSYGLETDVTTDLGVIVSLALFDLDPAGTRLAVMAYGAARAPGSLEAFRRPGTRQTAAAPDTVLQTGLWIVDVDDGTARRLDNQPATAPLWDPTGSRVLVRDALSGAGRWHVFDLDGTRTRTDVYDINESLLPTYLPFWDQYVRSQTVWSPDGTHFVHVGRPDNGESGVWIHDASTSGRSTLLADGDLAFWSPT
jgi:hypothetical protein